MELDDFTREMQYAASWRELRMLVDVIAEQLAPGRARGQPDEYSTFMIQRDDTFMLMGVRANEAGNEIHITQQVINQQGRSTGGTTNLKLVFDDIEDDAPKRARSQ